MKPSDSLDDIDSDSDRDRLRKSTKKIADYSETDPECLDDDIETLVRLLRVDDRKVRIHASYALHNVGRKDRSTVIPIASDLIGFLDSEQPSRKVRSNLARPIGGAIAEAPWRFDRSEIEAFAEFIDDEFRHVRHSVSWALEKVAFHCPERVLSDAISSQGHIDDDHPPVRKHVFRMLAHLPRYERWGPVPASSPRDTELLIASVDLEKNPQQVSDGLESDVESVRSAAATLAGAVGTGTLIDALRERWQVEQSDTVNRDIEHALREASYPTDIDTEAEPIDGAVRSGDWIAIDVTGHGDSCDPVPRTGEYRGRISDIDQGGSCAVDDGILQAKQAFSVSNPFEGYELRISSSVDGTTAVYTDRRQSDSMSFAVAEISDCDPDLMKLRYAIEGDTLSCSLDHGGYEGEVTTAGTTDGSYSVSVADNRGHTVRFSLSGSHPKMAMFDAGRCVPASDIEIATETDS